MATFVLRDAAGVTIAVGLPGRPRTGSLALCLALIRGIPLRRLRDPVTAGIGLWL
jgi:hypothetical protein